MGHDIQSGHGASTATVSLADAAKYSSILMHDISLPADLASVPYAKTIQGQYVLQEFEKVKKELLIQFKKKKKELNSRGIFDEATNNVRAENMMRAAFAKIDMHKLEKRAQEEIMAKINDFLATMRDKDQIPQSATQQHHHQQQIQQQQHQKHHLECNHYDDFEKYVGGFEERFDNEQRKKREQQQLRLQLEQQQQQQQAKERTMSRRSQRSRAGSVHRARSRSVSSSTRGGATPERPGSKRSDDGVSTRGTVNHNHNHNTADGNHNANTDAYEEELNSGVLASITAAGGIFTDMPTVEYSLSEVLEKYMESAVEQQPVPPEGSLNSTTVSSGHWFNPVKGGDNRLYVSQSRKRKNEFIEQLSIEVNNTVVDNDEFVPFESTMYKDKGIIFSVDYREPSSSLVELGPVKSTTPSVTNNNNNSTSYLPRIDESRNRSPQRRPPTTPSTSNSALRTSLQQEYRSYNQHKLVEHQKHLSPTQRRQLELLGTSPAVVALESRVASTPNPGALPDRKLQPSSLSETSPADRATHQQQESSDENVEEACTLLEDTIIHLCREFTRRKEVNTTEHDSLTVMRNILISCLRSVMTAQTERAKRSWAKGAEVLFSWDLNLEGPFTTTNPDHIASLAIYYVDLHVQNEVHLGTIMDSLKTKIKQEAAKVQIARKAPKLAITEDPSSLSTLQSPEDGDLKQKAWRNVVTKTVIPNLEKFLEWRRHEQLRNGNHNNNRNNGDSLNIEELKKFFMRNISAGPKDEQQHEKLSILENKKVLHIINNYINLSSRDTRRLFKEVAQQTRDARKKDIAMAEAAGVIEVPPAMPSPKKPVPALVLPESSVYSPRITSARTEKLNQYLEFIKKGNWDFEMDSNPNPPPNAPPSRPTAPNGKSGMYTRKPEDPRQNPIFGDTNTNGTPQDPEEVQNLLREKRYDDYRMNMMEKLRKTRDEAIEMFKKEAAEQAAAAMAKAMRDARIFSGKKDEPSPKLPEGRKLLQPQPQPQQLQQQKQQPQRREQQSTSAPQQPQRQEPDIPSSYPPPLIQQYQQQQIAFLQSQSSKTDLLIGLTDSPFDSTSHNPLHHTYEPEGQQDRDRISQSSQTPPPFNYDILLETATNNTKAAAAPEDKTIPQKRITINTETSSNNKNSTRAPASSSRHLHSSSSKASATGSAREDSIVPSKQQQQQSPKKQQQQQASKQHHSENISPRSPRSKAGRPTSRNDDNADAPAIAGQQQQQQHMQRPLLLPSYSVRSFKRLPLGEFKEEEPIEPLFPKDDRFLPYKLDIGDDGREIPLCIDTRRNSPTNTVRPPQSTLIANFILDSISNETPTPAPASPLEVHGSEIYKGLEFEAEDPINYDTAYAVQRVQLSQIPKRRLANSTGNMRRIWDKDVNNTNQSNNYNITSSTSSNSSSSSNNSGYKSASTGNINSASGMDHSNSAVTKINARRSLQLPKFAAQQQQQQQRPEDREDDFISWSNVALPRRTLSPPRTEEGASSARSNDNSNDNNNDDKSPSTLELKIAAKARVSNKMETTRRERDAGRNATAKNASQQQQQQQQQQQKTPSPSALPITTIGPPGVHERLPMIDGMSAVDILMKMEQIWVDLKTPAPLKTALFNKYNEGPYSNLLTVYNAFQLWREIGAEVMKRENALRELKEFEESGSDPKRFFKGKSTDRLQEEKLRAKLLSIIYKTGRKCEALARKLEREYHDTLTYEGVLYQEKMKNDYSQLLYTLEEKRLVTSGSSSQNQQDSSSFDFAKYYLDHYGNGNGRTSTSPPLEEGYGYYGSNGKVRRRPSSYISAR